MTDPWRAKRKAHFGWLLAKTARERFDPEPSRSRLPASLPYREADAGHIKTSAKMAGNLYRIATGSGREAVTAAIFWLNVRAGWREPLGVREYPMGEKEAQQLAARIAAIGTPWEGLLE
jgi:hypothetical protein